MIQAVVKQPCRPVGTTGGSICGYITIAPANATALSCAVDLDTNSTNSGSDSNSTAGGKGAVPFTLSVNVELDYPDLSSHVQGEQIPCFYDPRDCQLWSFLSRPPMWPMVLVLSFLSLATMFLFVLFWAYRSHRREEYNRF